MNYYDYKNISKCFVCGNINGQFENWFNFIKSRITYKDLEKESKKVEEIHPLILEEENELKNKYKNTISEIPMPGIATFNVSDFTAVKSSSSWLKKKVENILDNSVFVVLGGCNFGTNDFQSYYDFFEDCNKYLAQSNTTVLIVRGNNDDPSYFNEKKIDMDYVKCIPDYSIVQTASNTILCVGGGISENRTWLMQEEDRINKWRETNKKTLYYKEEGVNYNQDAIDDILSNGLKIDTVLTHIAPLNCVPSIDYNDNWFMIDTNLKTDIENERKCLQTMYEYLNSTGNKIKFWGYGHYNFDRNEEQNNTVFSSFNQYHYINEINEVLSMVELNKKVNKKSRRSKFGSIKSIEMPFGFAETATTAANGANGGIIDELLRDAATRINAPVPEDGIRIAEPEDGIRIAEPEDGIRIAEPEDEAIGIAVEGLHGGIGMAPLYDEPMFAHDIEMEDWDVVPNLEPVAAYREEVVNREEIF